jgi:hypothetical protein
MFEQLPATAIQDRLSDAIYKWRGIGNWPEAEATVSDYVWTPDAEMPGCGNYQVSFSYRINEKIRTGTLGINGAAETPPYSQGDTFILRYNPKRPSRYYYANVLSRSERIALIVGAVGIGAIAGLIVVSLFPR